MVCGDLVPSGQEMEALEKGPDGGEETRVFLACVNVATGDLDEVLGLSAG